MVRGHGRGGGGRPPPAPRRVLLVVPQAVWGRPHGLLRMRGPEAVVSGASAADAGLDPPMAFSFDWSSEYARLHDSYEALVATSPDPNMLMELIRHEPCHIGALAQLHEVASERSFSNPLDRPSGRKKLLSRPLDKRTRL